MEQKNAYPAELVLDYADRPMNRATTFFRPLMLIPAIILLVLLGGGGKTVSLGTVVVLPTLLTILFRRKYPKWWFDWNLAFVNFMTRIGAYACLLTDVYPSTDENQGVHVQLVYPQAGTELNRWLPLVKWLLAIPHYIVLMVLYVAVVVVVVAGWFMILINGRMPLDMFKFVEGVFRWHLRVAAYSVFLTTDIYPPFSLE
jgi:hypothetical protein